MIEVWLTKHMFGDKVEKIGEKPTLDEAMGLAIEWTKSDEAKTSFRVQPYYRVVGKLPKAAIDFGDYTYFLLLAEAEI